jgi:hypothetical protein
VEKWILATHRFDWRRAIWGAIFAPQGGLRPKIAPHAKPLLNLIFFSFGAQKTKKGQKAPMEEKHKFWKSCNCKHRKKKYCYNGERYMLAPHVIAPHARLACFGATSAPASGTKKSGPVRGR